MPHLNARDLRTVWRRRFFTFAIASLVLLALLLAIGSPIIAKVWQPGYLAPLVVIVEVVLVITGIGWLALFVMSKRRPPSDDDAV